MKIGICTPYRNPHLLSITDEVLKDGLSLSVSIFMGDSPKERAINKWNLAGGFDFKPSSINSWLALYRLIRDSDVIIWGGIPHPFPWMPICLLLVCLNSPRIYLVSEGLRKGVPSLVQRVFLVMINFLSEVNLLAIGNTCVSDFRKSGITWPAYAFGFAEKRPTSGMPKLKHKVSSRKIRLLAVGQLIKRKRIDWVIKAIMETGNADRYELVVCGTGAELDFLQQYAAECNVSAQFLGFKRGEDLGSEFEKADVFVHPAEYEGWGVVLNHAISYGLPVIASINVRSAWGLLVKDGDNGFIVNSIHELSQRLTQFEKDDTLVSRFSDRSLQIARHWTPAEIGYRLRSVILNPGVSYPSGEPLHLHDA